MSKQTVHLEPGSIPGTRLDSEVELEFEMQRSIVHLKTINYSNDSGPSVVTRMITKERLVTKMIIKSYLIIIVVLLGLSTSLVAPFA